jgi:predicted RNA-binding protein (virulence factor B family)
MIGSALAEAPGWSYPPAARAFAGSPSVIEVGRFHQLSVVELVAGGVLLGAAGRDLFLPSHLVATDVAVGDRIEVFVYTDGEGAPQATTWQPAAILGEIAYLRCVSVTRAGAYLDWGVPKDLYVPPDQQIARMVEGRRYVVAVCLDRKGERLMGSAHLAEHFDYDVEDVAPGDEVDLLVWGRTDAGIQVVVDRRHRGLIHHTNVHRKLPIGTKLRGWVDQVRHDNRLDISLTRRGMEGMKDAQETILAALAAAGGSLALHDGSPPEAIERALGMSKKAFKRGVGGLYKARRIAIDEHGIRLVVP